MVHEGTGEQSPYLCVNLLSHHVTMSLDMGKQLDLLSKKESFLCRNSDPQIQCIGHLELYQCYFVRPWIKQLTIYLIRGSQLFNRGSNNINY